ncbi:type II secretion system major pseudopilin GspG [Roseinatronobacter alkalisoli]|uniref:Type II secretion system core protein G n=1 Tax=Roseinatronobacter alkalisoli TaxID=3028235 RepID=A0ABT5TG99_9RHOB|nr:type II secretion system major pseudopilin GspG [Roseinatronobacter sp. HJB301]MDD7973715.1 type II secretion system major pseudopilin GspG [Roseinatronobacter sp. HJB301]
MGRYRCGLIRRNPQAGLSLLEVMVVLAVIVLIAGFATPRLMENFGRAKSRVAVVQIENIRSAVQLFQLDTGRVPSEAEGLGALLSAPQGLPNWQGPYVDSTDALLDPWQRPWIYRSPAGDRAFSITSYGRDGRPGGTNEDRDISR